MVGPWSPKPKTRVRFLPPLPKERDGFYPPASYCFLSFYMSLRDSFQNFIHNSKRASTVRIASELTAIRQSLRGIEQELSQASETIDPYYRYLADNALKMLLERGFCFISVDCMEVASKSEGCARIDILSQKALFNLARYLKKIGDDSNMSGAVLVERYVNSVSSSK